MVNEIEKESVPSEKKVDPELALFLQEMSELRDCAFPHGYPEHMRIRDALEREALYSETTPHIPERIQYFDGVMSLPTRELVFRLYRPIQAGTPAPAILYSHGGGWVAGSIYTHHALCAEIALRTSRVVISVQYRRAPENPFPSGHDDVWEAWRWLFRYGKTLGIDTGAIALAGDSAGGHLALTCALRHRLEGGEMDAADKLLLWYPNTDRRPQTESRKIYASNYGLDEDRMEFFWRCVEGHGQHDLDDYLLYPGHVSPPDGLPPAVIVTAEHDLLRDEAEQYARKMQAVGNEVILLRAGHMLHGFARLHRESAAATSWVRRGCLAFMQLSASKDL